jgi:hypothetical protein
MASKSQIDRICNRPLKEQGNLNLKVAKPIESCSAEPSPHAISTMTNRTAPAPAATRLAKEAGYWTER